MLHVALRVDLAVEEAALGDGDGPGPDVGPYAGASAQLHLALGDDAALELAFHDHVRRDQPAPQTPLLVDPEKPSVVSGPSSVP